jgi:hypothetical protein
MTGNRIEMRSNLKIGVPNENTGRLYPKKLFRKIMKKSFMVDLSEHMMDVDLAYLVGGISDLFIDEDNYLCGFLNINEKTPHGLVVKSLLERGANFELCPVGTGNVSDKNEVSNYKLTKMSIIAKENKDG